MPVIHLDFYWKKRSRPASSPILLSLLLVKRGQGQKIYRILQITKHTRIFFQDQWLPPFSLLATTMLKKTIYFFEYLPYVIYRYTFFCQITTFIKVRGTFVFGLQILLIDFTKIFQSKGLKDKGHTNFYEQFDLTKKYV